ncbi:MAG: class I SAM-dependent methyltransferase [Chloroflexi bacterium]|nr:class I SAM-dependent methyltransferase [Chloroflexota bacterium]
MSYSPEYFLARERWRDWRIEARELVRLARVTQGDAILEIGCGGGGLLRMLAARGARAVGVDTLDVALELARTRSKGESPTRLYYDGPSYLARIADDKPLPFANETFDAILAQHVIEHIAEINAAVREWTRVLKRGGRVALATPNARYPDPAHFADANHAHIFELNELTALLIDAGFEIENAVTVFPLLARARALRAAGVIAHDLFRRMPYFRDRGRTILIGARLI